MVFSISLKQNQYSTYILSDETALSRVEVVPERGGIITRWSIQGQEIFTLDEERFTHPDLSVRGGVPILFPLCGNLPDNTYTHDSKTYTLKQHGFARELPWTVTGQGTDSCASLTVNLKSNNQTYSVYPFNFTVKFTYELDGKVLRIRQQYTNESDKTMPFSAGFHPYFFVPNKAELYFDIPGKSYQDQRTKENFPFSGTFDFEQEEIDVMFKPLSSASATMIDKQRSLKIDLTWSDFYSTFVFWTVKGKDFVCLEPWSAPRNSLNTGENLTELAPGETCEAVFTIRVDSF
ncbi:aldose epimerase [Aphanothece sacrum]|uniref:Aldose 1-epimerase n=1 Tax=Aphanothece sacrum FPU1 TaxID=1920663 RepID=A0A401II61_APHSA|nr:aldose epimerase [Aphanothece sacrum]GBF80876.1 aldose 1-epimerase [Aphanothece sacrum FPU1]GBF85183.1 aldose 1-epimerase [Aphanothece sacrum FPU3]